MESISRSAIPIWRISGTFYALFLLISGGVTWFTLRFPNLESYWIDAGAGMAILFIIGAMVWVIPQIRWSRWKYHIHEDYVEIQHGIVNIERTLVPTKKVQHVSTERGPIQRMYGMATISVHTAATTHQIPIIPDEEALEVRDRIAALAKLGDADV